MRTWLLAICGVTLVAGANAAIADDDDVSLNQVPAQVRATIEREAQGGKIEDIERKMKDGKTFYKVEIERNDEDWTLKIDENGKVTKRKRDD